MACLHSADWWRRHWDRSGLVHVTLADTMGDGWLLWRDWQHAVAPDNQTEIGVLNADQGRHLGYVRAIAHRRGDRGHDEPIVSVPVDYSTRPVFRRE